MQTSRLMTLDDLDEVYRIEVESFHTPWSKESIQRDLVENSLSIYRVIEAGEDHKIVGFYALWMVAGETHIMNIAIDPAERRKGHGDFLMEQIRSDAVSRNAVHATLEVRRSNEAAIQLYEKHGFEATAIRKEYYEDNREDAYIMWANWEEE